MNSHPLKTHLYLQGLQSRVYGVGNMDQGVGSCSTHLHELLLGRIHAGAAAQVQAQPLVQPQGVVLRLVQVEGGAGEETHQTGFRVCGWEFDPH